MRPSTRAAAVFALGLVLGAGCGDDDGETSGSTTAATASTGETGTMGDASSTGMISADFEADVQPLFNANCTCHLAGPSGLMAAPIMNLNPGNAYDQIVGVASEQVPALRRVEPGDPAMSYLFAKVTDTHLDLGGSGTPMPPGIVLPDETLAILEAWIAAGATP
jgi:hypothetical protein